MKIELKKIKIGPAGRNGCGISTAELYVDGVLTAYMRDEARGGMLDIDIMDDQKFSAFERHVTSQQSTYNEFDNMDVDEWYANEIDMFEVDKKIKRKLKTQLVAYKRKSGEIVSANYREPLEDVLKDPRGKQAIKEKLKEWQKYFDEGFVLMNKNLESLM